MRVAAGTDARREGPFEVEDHSPSAVLVVNLGEGPGAVHGEAEVGQGDQPEGEQLGGVRGEAEVLSPKSMSSSTAMPRTGE